MALSLIQCNCVICIFGVDVARFNFITIVNIFTIVNIITFLSSSLSPLLSSSSPSSPRSPHHCHKQHDQDSSVREHLGFPPGFVAHSYPNRLDFHRTSLSTTKAVTLTFQPEPQTETFLSSPFVPKYSNFLHTSHKHTNLCY